MSRRAPAVLEQILTPWSDRTGGVAHDLTEELMYDDREERERRQLRDLMSPVPVPRLAGADEDEPPEPHIVRGID